MDVVFGRYRLLDRLGQGGMAEVFKAKSYGVEGFEKTLVIKRILPELSSRREFVDLFVHEAKLAVRLSHANIVQVFDLGKAPREDGAGGPGSDAYYIAMEYVYGLDLATVLARARRRRIAMPIGVSAHIAAEIAKGLDHAHRRMDEQMRPLGVVHRDVSPQNVLLSFEGEVKVTDFGIARARGLLDAAGGEDTRTMVLRGKYAYNSPEQSRGEEIDARSDLFSLGTVLYECLAGVNPFSAPTRVETLRRVQACECPPLERLRPDVPKELAAIVGQAMARERDGRFSDAGRLYEALLAFSYARADRSGAHEVAEFVHPLRDDSAPPAAPPRPDGPPRVASTSSKPARAAAVSGASRPARVEAPAAVASAVRSVESSSRLDAIRDVTAMFIDLSPGARDDDVERAVRTMARWGARVVRRGADRVAAVFGASDADARDLESAARCALALLRADADGTIRGVGLNTGGIRVAADGAPRDDHRLAACIEGARGLASLARGRAVIAPDAAALVRHAMELEPLRDLGASGGPAAAVVAGVHGGAPSVRFVGRKGELRRLASHFTSAGSGGPRVVTLSGPHGIGKTRLLYEVERRLARGAFDVRLRSAACPPGGSSFALSGLVTMLHALCGAQAGGATGRPPSVGPHLLALGLSGEQAECVLSALADASRPHSGRDAGLLRDAFARMVQAFCADRPYVLAWDDADAMDDESAAWLREIVRRVPALPLCFVFVARAPLGAVVDSMERHAAVELGELPADHADRLAALKLGVDVAPAEVLRAITAYARGRPLLVEHVVEWLLDSGAVSTAERRVVAVHLPGEANAAPRAIRRDVAARLAALPPEARRVVQSAAGLGEEIEASVLAAAVDRSDASIEALLADHSLADFLVADLPGKARFASPLVRHAVVATLVPEAAREIHAAAVRALEASVDDGAPERIARIASHLDGAGDRRRAPAYLARSGTALLATHAFEAAARDLARAISSSDPRDPSTLPEVEWLEALAGALRFAPAPPDSDELCARVIAAADRDPPVASVRVRARAAAVQVLAAAGRFADARARRDEADAMAAEDAALAAYPVAADVELALRQGEFARAVERLDALRRLEPSRGHGPPEYRVALMQAQAFAAVGDRSAALSALCSAERLLPTDPASALELSKANARTEHFAGDLRAAAIHGEEAVRLARALGLPHEVAVNLHVLGDVLAAAGDYARARGAIEQSAAAGAPYDSSRLANANEALLAFLDGAQAVAAAAAETRLARAVAYAEARDWTDEVVGGTLFLARLRLQLGRQDEARADYEAARARAVAAGRRLAVEECDAALAELGKTPPVRAVTREATVSQPE